MRYKAIIKTIITPHEYKLKTGIDLSHTDTSQLKCVEIDEHEIEAPSRKVAFSQIVKSLGSLKKPVSLSIAPI